MTQQALTAYEGDEDALEAGISAPATHCETPRNRAADAQTLTDAVDQAQAAGRTVDYPEPDGWTRGRPKHAGERAIWVRGPVTVSIVEVTTRSGTIFEVYRQDDRNAHNGRRIATQETIHDAVSTAVRHMQSYPIAARGRRWRPVDTPSRPAVMGERQ